MPYTFDAYSPAQICSHLKLQEQYMAQHRKFVDSPTPLKHFIYMLCYIFRKSEGFPDVLLFPWPIIQAEMVSTM